jgi:hypothetical protein
MASVESTGSLGSPSSFMMDNTIDLAQIDNLSHAYYLKVTMGDDYNLWLNYVVIEYTVSEPY